MCFDHQKHNLVKLKHKTGNFEKKFKGFHRVNKRSCTELVSPTLKCTTWFFFKQHHPYIAKLNRFLVLDLIGYKNTPSWFIKLWDRNQQLLKVIKTALILLSTSTVATSAIELHHSHFVINLECALYVWQANAVHCWILLLSQILTGHIVQCSSMHWQCHCVEGSGLTDINGHHFAAPTSV